MSTPEQVRRKTVERLLGINYPDLDKHCQQTLHEWCVEGRFDAWAMALAIARIRCKREAPARSKMPSESKWLAYRDRYMLSRNLGSLTPAAADDAWQAFLTSGSPPALGASLT